MKRSERPIGVFDSGVGGLTVYRALRRRMPLERLIYFGDTAHLPYGAKSPEAVRAYSLAIGRFLLKKRIKLLTVACNTASALALDALRGALPVPVVGVIEPGAKAAVHATRTRRVGVIGTEGTVASGAYAAALRLLDPSVHADSEACPVFVPIVEEGWWDNEVAEAAALRYLKPLKRYDVDTLILGCTHYPLLKPVLHKVMGPKVQLVDSAEETAREVESLLKTAGLAAEVGPASNEFYVSDAPERFKKLAKRLLGLAVSDVQVLRLD